jgi:hypothetical protein
MVALMVVFLPDASVFNLPRYPNVWFYVSTDIAPGYERATQFVIDSMSGYLGVRADAGHAHDILRCDARATIRNLQPYRGYSNHRHNHSHALDIRYYYKLLRANEMEQATLEIEGRRREFFRVAAQVRYEASLAHNPPDDCPVCGRAGDYADVDGDVNRLVRDPLGLELCLHGTVRGRPVSHPSGFPVRGVQAMASDYDLYFGEFDTQRPEDETPRVGCVAVLNQGELSS